MKLTWTPASVGCHWNATGKSGSYSISTRTSFKNGVAVRTYPDSGYVLLRDRNEVGVFKNLKAAQRAAEALEAGYGVCILCHTSTRRKINERRPCCRKCEHTAPVAATCPTAFTKGAAGQFARSCEAAVRAQQ